MLSLALGLLIWFIAAEIAALRCWRGAWRLVALLPAVAVIVVALRIVVDVRRDPTSHNLWPFEVTMWSGLGLGFLALMFVVDLITHASSQRR